MELDHHSRRHHIKTVSWLLFGANISAIVWREQVNFQWDDDDNSIITWCFSYWPSYRSEACCIEILDLLINKDIITWCFSYWPSYRSSVCCIGVRLRLRPIQQASDLSDGCKNINLLALYYQLEFLLLHHIISSFNSVFAIIVLIFHVLPHNQDEKRFTPSPCFYCLDHECFCNNGTQVN
jgi:hypothetical protein